MAYWNYAVMEFKRGEELIGDVARYLAHNSPTGTVEVLDADPIPVPASEVPQVDSDAPGPAGVSSDEPPVDGTIDALMTWVNGDPGKAGRALAAEQAKDKPRSTVVKRLAAFLDTE
jgi:hypothetical protein